ncbi:hypothetical protein BASA81_001110 [Batrachochytrium salamandrivorans]|nr:hypothetical protein BASA81_001110 [Batrachochytrium salamandrivorans]
MAEVFGFTQDRRDGYVVYKLRVGGKETTTKRFSQFLQLRQDLSNHGNNNNLPLLPSKLFSTSPASRLPKLDLFLSLLCRQFAHEPPKQLLNFLAINRNEFLSALNSKQQNSMFQVKVGTCKIPTKYATEISQVKRELLQISKQLAGKPGEVDSSGEWKLVGSKGAWAWFVKATTRAVVGELTNCPPSLAHELIMDEESVRVLEPSIAELVELERLDEHTVVQYFGMKSIMMQTAREVIFVRHWSVELDGTIVHVEFSLDEHPGKPKSNRVRAKMTCGGTVIVPVHGEKSCKIWRATNLDPLLGDNLPAWAERKIHEYTSKMLSDNMFALEKLVRRRGNGHRTKPLVNWNGMVSGGYDNEATLAATDEGGAVAKPVNWARVADAALLALWVAFASALLLCAASGKRLV